MDSFLKQHLNDDHCFLCGKPLKKQSRSDEHIIPVWLQKKHNLWNQKITLLNRTEIPYRQLLIPCCKECNNGPLSRLEDEVSNFLTGSFTEPTRQQEYRLFQWCNKILYGLLHKEMMLILDRRTESKESIVRKEFLERITTFHHFLTSIRRNFNFVDFVPYSIFVNETLTFNDSSRNFDYFDFIALGRQEELTVILCLAIRIKHFGIVCVFQDNGYQKQFFQNQFDRFRGIPLHPIQFLELACNSAYKHSLITFQPRYHSIAHDDPDSIINVIQASYPDEEIWADWDYMTYANIFSSLAKRAGFSVPSPDEFFVGDKHYTWLSDEDGKPKIIREADELTEFI